MRIIIGTTLYYLYTPCIVSRVDKEARVGVELEVCWHVQCVCREYKCHT